MPSAFVSYAHEDQQFVLTLVEHLDGQGLEVRFDQVALHVGDSLIRALTREIMDGDFLVAVISPASLDSEWCRTELELALVQGINERRVKVLPVRFDGAEMPPALMGTVWADADRDDVETVARRVAAAIRAHVEGRDADAAREAEGVQQLGRPAPHIAPDAAVPLQIDEVAALAFEIVEIWSRVWRREANLQEIGDPQRRLRWALDRLPDRVQAGLPLVRRLATEEWRSDFFATEESLVTVEGDLEVELRAVRTQITQGLPVTPRWRITEYRGRGAPERRDAVSHHWRIVRGGDAMVVSVYISGTALESLNDALPQEVAEAKETDGRSVVRTVLSVDEPPPELSVTTAGVAWELPP